MAEADGSGAPGIGLGADGGNWRDTYLKGSELYEAPDLGTIPDVPTLAKVYVDTKTFVGRKGLIPPKEGDPPEVAAAFWKEWGRPESPENYEIPRPEEMPKDFPYSEDLEKQFRQWGFDAGLNSKQMQDLYNGYLKANLDFFQQQGQQEAEARTALEAGLKTKWGGKYEENLLLAQQAQQRFAPAGSAALQELDKVMGDNPLLLEMFYAIGAAMSEATLLRGDPAKVKGLEIKRRELMSHPAFMDKNHPEHQKVVDEVRGIAEQMFPEMAA